MARSSPADILRLRKTVRAACAHDDVDRAFATVLRLLSEAHGWAVAEAWIARPDGSALEMAPVCYCRDDHHRPFVDVALGFVVDRGIGLPGIAWESRRPVVTRDVLEERRFARAALATDFGFRGALTVPVPAEHPVVILSFFDTQPRELDSDLVETLADVGRDIATLVRRRRRGLDLERQLRVTEQRYRAFFERSPAGLFIADPNGTIVEGNAALATILGIASVVGQRFAELLVDPGAWVELQLRRADGSVRRILVHVAKVDDHAGVHVEGVLLDVTDR